MKFTEIPDKLKYPPAVKAKISSIHSILISHVVESGTFSGSMTDKLKIMSAINAVTYWLCCGNKMPLMWSSDSPFNHIPVVDDNDCKEYLGDLYVSVRDVVWDVDISADVSFVKPKPVVATRTFQPMNTEAVPTDKSDLSIQPPAVPRFDVRSTWMASADGSMKIYRSLPVIPTKQCEISATTDISLLTDNDLLNLFPNRLVQTRSPGCYVPVTGLSFDSKLGVLFPINGFSEEAVKDNIVKYPHIYKLLKVKDDSLISFYSTIELDGELYRISDVWQDIPESQYIPYTVDFVKEYVVRRYLLERDILGMQHRYPMFGDLSPFLTLFATPDDYAEFGYSDKLKLARMCVKARIQFKQSRNPVIRRIRGE